jgi:hypothetical protein
MKETFFRKANGFLSPNVFQPLYESGSMRNYHMATRNSHQFSGFVFWVMEWNTECGQQKREKNKT